MQLPEDRLRDPRLHLTQFEAADPTLDILDREPVHVGNRGGADLDIECPRLDPCSAAGAAYLGALVLAKKHADVVLVALPLPRHQERDHPLEPLGSVEDRFPEILGKLRPRAVQRRVLLQRKGAQLGSLAVISGLRPGIDRPLINRAGVIGYDEVDVVVERGAETGTHRAGSIRIVERKQLGRRLEELDLRVFRAAEVLGERQAFRDLPPAVACTAAATVDQHDGLTLSFDEARAQRIGQAIAVVLRNCQTIHDHERLGHLREIEADVLHGLSAILTQIDQDPVREDPDEPHRPKVLDHEPVFHPARKLQREGHLDPCALGQGEHVGGGTRHGVGPHFVPALRAVRTTHARPEQPEVVVHLGSGSDRGATGFGGILLLDCHGGRDSLDRVDVGLLHALEKLLRVGRERLDVPALPFGEQGVQRQRRLTGARRSGDHREGPPR